METAVLESPRHTASPTTQRYAKCIETSKRIRWDVDRDVIRGRQFDFGKKFMPDGLSKIGELTFLRPSEARFLSQIQGRTYANMFALVERFIGVKMLEIGKDHGLGDQVALEALVRLTDEELKHQELFRRLDEMAAAGMPAGYSFKPQPNEVASAVLGKSTWPVLGLIPTSKSSRRPTTARASSRTATCPTSGRMSSCSHWKEESQHAILDELEWRREDARLNAREREQGVTDLIDLVAAVDATLPDAGARRCGLLRHRGRDDVLAGREDGHPRRPSCRVPRAIHRQRRAGTAFRRGPEVAGHPGADGTHRRGARADRRRYELSRRGVNYRPRPAVVLLHASASSARQWDRLAEILKPRFRVHAVDLYGHGVQPPWRGTSLSLADEAALVAPLLAEAGAHVIGHSYGGAVALKLASLYPQLVHSVAAYEPVMFRWLFEDARHEAMTWTVGAVAQWIRDRLAERDRDSAARGFIDFWSGGGAWQSLPETRRNAIASRMGAVAQHFEALFRELLTQRQVSRLPMPMLFMTGSRTVAPMQTLASVLRQLLPEARHEELDGMGHMGPMTMHRRSTDGSRSSYASGTTRYDAPHRRRLTRGGQRRSVARTTPGSDLGKRCFGKRCSRSRWRAPWQPSRKRSRHGFTGSATSKLPHPRNRLTSPRPSKGRSPSWATWKGATSPSSVGSRWASRNACQSSQRSSRGWTSMSSSPAATRSSPR